MSGERLAQFMWWVPLVGSALGNVLGGLISDRAVSRAANAMDTESAAEDTDEVYSADTTPWVDLGNDGVELGLYPEQRIYETKQVIMEAETNSNLVRTNVNSSSAIRFLVCSLGNLSALPFVCGAILLDYPYCFLVQIFSGLLAEMYLGQTLVVVSDTTLTGVPQALCTPSVALFMLLVTLIGGNMPLLLPLVENIWGYTETVIQFNAITTVADSVNATSGLL